MSKQSKLRRKELKSAKRIIQSGPSSTARKAENQNPRHPEGAKEPKQGVIDWVRKHKITTFIAGVFAFSLGGPLNFFGSNPRIFYFPALVLCVLICWIVMSATHKFVNYKLTENKQEPVLAVKQPNKAAAIPSNAAPRAPELDNPEFSEKVEKGVIELGDGGLGIRFSADELRSQKCSPITLGDKPEGQQNPLVVYMEGNKLFCDFKTQVHWIAGPATPFELRHNELVGMPPNWDLNKSKSALEVVDQNTNPILQLYYKTPSHIVINGDFPQMGFSAKPKRLIFKYPAWRHPGEYADK
jgi:hypothetical protein